MKNTPNTNKDHERKPSSSRWIIRFTASTAIIASIFSANPSYNQTTKRSTNNFQGKNNWELLEKNDGIDHNKVIHMSFDSILAKYGKEKGLETIRNHFLIEINTYRKLHNRQPLSFDPTLNEAAQKFAEYGSPYKALGHHFDGKGIAEMGIDVSSGYSARGENVAYGIKDIATVVADRYYRSEGHKKTMIGLRVSKYTGDTITYSSLGIGISGPFIVAEFATPIKK